MAYFPSWICFSVLESPSMAAMPTVGTTRTPAETRKIVPLYPSRVAAYPALNMMAESRMARSSKTANTPNSFPEK